MKFNWLFIIIFFLMSAVRVNTNIQSDIKEIKENMETKNEFQIYMKSIDKRFEDMQKYMDKRFNTLTLFMGLGFSALGFFTVFIFNLLRKQMDKRFEEVTNILLILVKAHEEEIGPEIIDVTLGKKPMEKINTISTN